MPSLFGKCKVCKKEFSLLGKSKNRPNDFCSLKCYWEARRGSDKYKGYWTGKRLPDEVCKRISETLKAKPFTIRKNDDNLCYGQRHKRLYIANGGHPKKCDFCGKIGEKKNRRWTVEWAKKHGHKYTTSLDDYLSLCQKCHWHYDHKRID